MDQRAQEEDAHDRGHAPGDLRHVERDLILTELRPRIGDEDHGKEIRSVHVSGECREKRTPPKTFGDGSVQGSYHGTSKDVNAAPALNSKASSTAWTATVRE